MKNKMTIKKDFDITEYVSLVDELVDEFFNEDGEYQPHIGKLNALRLFYNKCVKSSKFDLPHDFTDALMLKPLIQDKVFMAAFNSAIKKGRSTRLDFANAYAEATEIVNAKRDSFGNLATVVKTGLNNLLKSLSPAISEENISNISKIADGMKSGTLGWDSFINLYSEHLKNDETESPNA